ncbi:hypothetical protein [Paracoccus sp. (in: a-proteobacteria)]|uniref:hypothetical protein n=1 Tax=Paracoccus sp. TaxID=267 RepID=UPI00396C9600
MFNRGKGVAVLVIIAVLALITIIALRDHGWTPALAETVATRPVVGEIVSPQDVQPIRNLGSYGLGPHLPGSVYAITAGHLVRIDANSGKILSVLRPLPRPVPRPAQ